MKSRSGGALVILQSVLIFFPLVVLGAAIGWPASLDDPAAVALPRLLDNEGAVRAGYIVYLAFSVLFFPAAALVTTWIHRRRPDSVWVRIALGMALASAALRTIGIVRWLSTMFPLAERWEGADPTTREAIAIQFEALNDYGGAVGEVLGVSLFAVGWLAITVAAAFGDDRTAPRWMLIAGGLAAALLTLPLGSLAGLDGGALATTLGSTAVGVWMLVTGVTMIRSPNGPEV